MVYLPNDLNILRQRLIKAREDLGMAQKRFESFISTQKLELYDKFVAEPLELAKNNEKECQRLLTEKESQLKELQAKNAENKEPEFMALEEEMIKQIISYKEQLLKAKQDIIDIKQKGLNDYNEQIEKDKDRKTRELKLAAFKTDIRNIKQRMLEIDPNSLNEDANKKTIVQSAQSRFELNF